MAFSYTVPCCMDSKTAIGALSSLLGVLFASSISAFFLILFTEEMDAAAIISLVILFFLLASVAYAFSNLFSEAPDLSIARNSAFLAIYGLLSVVLIQLYPYLPYRAAKIAAYVVTACLLLAICLFHSLSMEFKERCLCFSCFNATVEDPPEAPLLGAVNLLVGPDVAAACTDLAAVRSDLAAVRTDLAAVSTDLSAVRTNLAVVRPAAAGSAPILPAAAGSVPILTAAAGSVPIPPAASSPPIRPLQ